MNLPLLRPNLSFKAIQSALSVSESSLCVSFIECFFVLSFSLEIASFNSAISLVRRDKDLYSSELTRRCSWQLIQFVTARFNL